MSSRKSQIWIRRIRGWASVLLIVMVTLVIFRNPIAKSALIHLAPSIVGLDLDVDQIRIGWTAIEFIGIRVDEPMTTDMLQLETGKVRIELTLQDGFRNGSWAKRIDVLRPTLHLRYDEAGNLTSKFPTSNQEPASGPIPIRELLVHDASIIIHQRGREPFTIGGIKIVGQFGESIRIHGEVQNIFGGIVAMQANLNATTLAGQSNFAIENVVLNSHQLDNLPLLPDSIRQLGLSANLDVSVAIDHPEDPFDLGGYQAKLVSVLQQVHSTKHGSLLDRIECSVTSTDGILEASFAGDPLHGSIDAVLHSNLKQHPISADASLTVQSCDLQTIGAEFFPDAQLNAKTSVFGKAHLTYENQSFQFTGGFNAIANSISILDIPLEDILVSVSANGIVPAMNASSLSGSIKGRVETLGVAIENVAERFQLPAATGRVAANAAFAIPLEHVTDPVSYSVNANVLVTDISMADWTLHDTTVGLTLEKAVADASINNAIISDPQSNQVFKFAATAKANLINRGKFAAALEMAFSPSQTLFAACGISDLEPTGNFRVNVSAQNQLDLAAQPETWSANTTIQGRGLAIAGETIGDLNGTCVLKEGNFAVPQFQIPWRNSIFTLGGNGSIAGGLEVDGTIVTNSIPVEDVLQAASRLSNQPLVGSGTASLGGGVQVRIPDWNFNAADIRAGGQAKVSGSRFADASIGDLDLTWNANPSQLTVQSRSRDFFGGSYVIDATMQSLDLTKTVINGQFRDVQASRLFRLSNVRLPITGVFNGGLEINGIESLETAKGRVWMTSQGLTAQRIPVELSKGILTLDSGFIELSADGKVSRGKFKAQARTSLPGLLEFAESETQQVEKLPLILNAQVTDVPINTLKDVVPLPVELQSLQGNLSATVDRGVSMLDGHKICDVNWTLENLLLNRVRLSDRILGEISVQHDRASLTRLAGRFADGRLSGRADLSLTSNPSGTFEFAANRMSLRRLGESVVRDQDLSGTGTLSVRGNFGQQIFGRADLKLDHSVLAGVRVRQAKFPIDWSYSQPSQIARWQCRTGLISLGGGKVRVASEGSYGSSLNMTTEARIERVDTSKLIVGKSIGAGTITGNVNINAKRASSSKQFTGRFDFELANPQALELPVLNQLPTVVSLTPSRPGVGEDGGYVEGRLAGGLVHVDQLAIIQNNIQVLMSGNTTQEGRLDFDVIVNTNASGPADQLLELANTPLMLAAPAPVALISKANDLLKDRIVYVHVGGMASRPTIQLQPGKQLSQDVVKFFLSNALGSQAAEIATRRSQTKRR